MLQLTQPLSISSTSGSGSVSTGAYAQTQHEWLMQLLFIISRNLYKHTHTHIGATEVHTTELEIIKSLVLRARRTFHCSTLGVWIASRAREREQFPLPLLYIYHFGVCVFITGSLLNNVLQRLNYRHSIHSAYHPKATNVQQVFTVEKKNVSTVFFLGRIFLGVISNRKSNVFLISILLTNREIVWCEPFKQQRSTIEATKRLNFNESSLYIFGKNMFFRSKAMTK